MRLYHQRLATFYAATRALELGLITARSGDKTVGHTFALQYPSSELEGVEISTPVAASFKVSLWDLDGVRVREQIFALGVGVHECRWTNKYVIDEDEWRRQQINGISPVFYTLGVYEITGSFYVNLTADTDHLWVPNVGGYVRQAGTGFLSGTWPGFSCVTATGDAKPTSGGTGSNFIEPILSYELEEVVPPVPPPPGPWPSGCASFGIDEYGQSPYGDCHGVDLLPGPTVARIEVLDLRTLLVTFSADMADTADLVNPLAYKLTGGARVTGVTRLNPRQVRLRTGRDLRNRATYWLTVLADPGV
jgi:hypothetical protein